MSRYIDADALCKELKKRQNAAYNWSSESRAINNLEGEIRSDAALAMLSEVKLTIDAQPTANVRENVTGKWERHYSRPNVFADLFWHCSICGYRNENQYANRYHLYCPHCGAKMEGTDADT